MSSRSTWWIWGVAAFAAVWGIVYADVRMRAHSSFLEAEKYMDWNEHPDKKRDYFNAKFESDKAMLLSQREKEKMPDDVFNEKMASLEFDRSYALGESSLKYAYQWYKDTYELFSPPESKWVKMARAKAPVALDLWKQELRAQNIPFEETNFE